MSRLAVLETTLQGDFEEVLLQLEQAVTQSISAIMSGGSQAMFFKVNIWGRKPSWIRSARRWSTTGNAGQET